MEVFSKDARNEINQGFDLSTLFCIKTSSESALRNSLGLVFFGKQKVLGICGYSNRTIFEPLFTEHVEANFFLLFLQEKGQTEAGFSRNWKMLNLNRSVIQALAAATGLSFIEEKPMPSNVCFANAEGVRAEFKTTFGPTAVFDYCYAQLHWYFLDENLMNWDDFSTLKITFPTDNLLFWQVVEIGEQLRKLHLLEHHFTGNLFGQFANKTEKNVLFKTWLAGNLSQNLWNFKVGNFQVVQQWIRQFRDSAPTDEQILEFENIISAVEHTVFLYNKLRSLLG